MQKLAEGHDTDVSEPAGSMGSGADHAGAVVPVPVPPVTAAVAAVLVVTAAPAVVVMATKPSAAAAMVKTIGARSRAMAIPASQTVGGEPVDR
jgi:hypothetical protein